jgi:hypothetical protein
MPKVPPRFDALLFATRIGGSATTDVESAGAGGSGPFRIPIDRYVHLTSWSAFVWDNGQPQTVSTPAQACLFRLYLERQGTTVHTPAGQTVFVTSQQGAADSGPLDVLLLPNDVLIASWRGVANAGAVGSCRLLGTYVLL